MNKDPLESLESFYQSLDSIPTPPLAPKRPRFWGHWTLAFAPLGTAIVAYAFMSFCASGPTSQSDPVQLRFSIDRYALDEIRTEAPAHKSGTHASNTISWRSIG